MDFIFLDLHQRTGSQCWHSGEGQQPLHGGDRFGDPGSSGCWGGARLCCHETLKEEEKRLAPLSCVDLDESCLYNC